FGYRVVILDRVARYADGANDFAAAVLDGQAAGEGDEAAVRHLNVEERAAGLRSLA
nr:hypothetical protein [Tanacetum cinerariifolium]